MPRYRKKLHGKQEDRTLDLIEQVRVFKDFQRDIAPQLQQAIKEKWSAEKIYSHFQDVMAARGVTIALTDPDAAKALSAIKTALEFGVGKPAEKLQIEGKLSKVTDAELDALILTKLGKHVINKDH